MALWTWVVLIVIVLAVIVLVGIALSRRRTTALQRRFGPEYDQTVASSDGRRAAEAELQGRARRREQLNIVPLPEPERLRFAEQWRGIQEQFVDQPSEAVTTAETLLARVMKRRGYPVNDFEEQASLVSVDHPQLVQDYRIAHEIHDRNLSRRATTEELREAVLRYRSLFDDLLRPEAGNGHGARGGSDQNGGRHVAGTREGEQ